MKIKSTSLIVFLLAITVSLFIGYGAGFIHGFRNALIFDSPGRGLYDILELRQLRRGEVDKVIKTKEEDLDFLILQHGEYLQNGNPLMVQLYFTYFSDPRWKTVNKDYRDFMHTIVKHRTEYPIQMTVPEFTQDTDEKVKKEMTQNFKTRIETIKKTLTQYGWKENP